jgi:hypothetical protein
MGGLFVTMVTPEFETEAKIADRALDDMLVAGDDLFNGLQRAVRGAETLWHATWKFHRAAWRMRHAWRIGAR